MLTFGWSVGSHGVVLTMERTEGRMSPEKDHKYLAQPYTFIWRAGTADL